MPSSPDNAQIESVRNEFEAAWQRGERPQIEPLLQGLAVSAQRSLLKLLLPLELAFRQQAGETPAVEEYVARFADHRALVEDLFTGATLSVSLSNPDETLSGGIPDSLVQSGPRRELPKNIPGYEIEAELHRGGQGVVYKAVQLSTKREVALKVLLSGRYASDAERRRFEREVDLTASLTHPNIITLYDSGVTEDGLHYLAMEYVTGSTLDDYVESGTLHSLEEVLELFLKICDAVNYAHQRGVIHRDLKPHNILIDGDGEPHVLDFGLARPAGGLEKDDLTVTGQFLGTLAYASPEQVEGDPSKIDTRTDIYSLGVVLYKMLTGGYPYPVIGQMADVLRAIAEAPPEPPSSTTRRRQQESPSLPVLRLDSLLDAVSAKALEKSREARYQSVSALADDLRKYLAGEPPLHAQPPSVAHLAWLWVRKNVSVAVWALAIGFLGTFPLNLGTFGLMMGDMQRTLEATHREFFPSLSPPSLVGSGISETVSVAAAIVGLVLYLTMGLAIVLIIRPRDVWSDLVAGITAGTSASIVTYTIMMGLGMVMALVVVPHMPDLNALTQQEAIAVDDAANPRAIVDFSYFIKKYPDLAGRSVGERGPAIMTKMLIEMVTASQLAVLTGLIGSLGYGMGMCVCQALAAGHFRRRCKSTATFLLLYFLVGLPFSVLGCFVFMSPMFLIMNRLV